MGRLLGQPDSADTPERGEADAGAFPLWVKQTRKWSLAELKKYIPNLNKILNKTDIKI